MPYTLEWVDWPTPTVLCMCQSIWRDGNMYDIILSIILLEDVLLGPKSYKISPMIFLFGVEKTLKPTRL